MTCDLCLLSAGVVHLSLCRYNQQVNDEKFQLTISSFLGSKGVWVWSPASAHPCIGSLVLFWCTGTCRLLRSQTHKRHLFVFNREGKLKLRFSSLFLFQSKFWTHSLLHIRQMSSSDDWQISKDRMDAKTGYKSLSCSHLFEKPWLKDFQSAHVYSFQFSFLWLLERNDVKERQRNLFWWVVCCVMRWETKALSIHHLAHCRTLNLSHASAHHKQHWDFMPVFISRRRDEKWGEMSVHSK